MHKALSYCTIQNYTQLEALITQREKLLIEMKTDLENDIIIDLPDCVPLPLNVESVMLFLLKIEELLKALTLFTNCKTYFEDIAGGVDTVEKNN